MNRLDYMAVSSGGQDSIGHIGPVVPTCPIIDLVGLSRNGGIPLNLLQLSLLLWSELVLDANR